MGARHQTHVITQPPSFATSDEGLYCILSPFLLILILLVFCLPHKSVFCVLHWSLLNCKPWTRSTTQFLATETFFFILAFIQHAIVTMRSLSYQHQHRTKRSFHGLLAGRKPAQEVLTCPSSGVSVAMLRRALDNLRFWNSPSAASLS